MTLVVTKAKDALVKLATSVASAATTATLTDVATAMTDLSSEISSSSPTTVEFFGSSTQGSSALVWSDIIKTAAIVVHQAGQIAISTNTKTIADKHTIIADKQTLIETHLDRIQSTVEDTTSSCATGPHMRMLGGGCAHDSEMTRALVITNMKKTGTLEEVRSEINNPTPFP